MTDYRRHSLRRLLPFTLLAGLVCGVLVSACTSQECYDNQNSLPLAGFYSSYPEETPHSVTLDSVSIYGVGAPTILEDSVVGISQVYLPFRVNQETTQYVFKYLTARYSGLTDTITFRYKEIPYFVSEACGAIYKYEIQEITTTGNLIDSVACPDGVIDNVAVENLKIYISDNTVENRL